MHVAILDRELFVALMGELGADDRINLLMIIDTIRTALAMSEIHSDDYVLSIDELNSIKGALTKLEPHLGRFDASLHDVFVRDSGMKPA